jgi:hypothetical protein
VFDRDATKKVPAAARTAIVGNFKVTSGLLIGANFLPRALRCDARKM